MRKGKEGIACEEVRKLGEETQRSFRTWGGEGSVRKEKEDDRDAVLAA